VTSTLHIGLLGDFRIENGDAPIEGVDRPRLQSLLAYLLLHADAPQLRQHVAFIFWPDSSEAQARTNLRKQIYHLRHALPQPDRYLNADSKNVQWQPDAPFTLDVAQFEAQLARAKEAEASGEQQAERDAFAAAVALYKGDLLPGSYDDWVLTERERLSQQFIAALERLILLCEEGRDYQAGIEYAQRLLRHDPVHEASYRRLMRLHALNGDRARALRAYHTCATILERELGVEPSAQTQEAYQRLLRMEARPAQRRRRVTASSLVGRDREWSQLQTAWRAASRGQPQMVLLTGDPGIGKTRLAEEMLNWARRQGVSNASTRCYASESELAYAPLSGWLRAEALQSGLPSLNGTWLRELARLLPEITVQVPDIAPPGPLTESWQRQRLFEALSQAFHTPRQLVLLLDNLQWCDDDTLEWLLYLLRHQQSSRTGRQRPSRILVVGTLRSWERTGDDQLASLLADLRRSQQLTEIELGPLDREETVSLATNVAGQALDPALAAELYRETEGNPLFLIEMVRAWLHEDGRMPAARQSHAAGGLPLPPAVHEAIRSRLGKLSPTAREMAGVAAIIGRDFTYPVVAHACRCDEVALVRGLDELWQRRVVREQGTEAYDFGHEKIREVIVSEMSAARRRLLHRQVAQALELIHADDLDAVSAQIAAHYEQAGLPEKAQPYYHRAAAQLHLVLRETAPSWG
jgi:DNA-binding SARP family transcriptional activator